MEARVHDPASLRRLLTLVDNACAAGLVDRTKADRLKSVISAELLSSREIAELTMSLLLGEIDQVDEGTPASLTTKGMAVPTHAEAVGHRSSLQPSRKPDSQVQAIELDHASNVGELTAAWLAFASLAQGLTTRPWAEVERAFTDAGSREAAEVRGVAAGAPIEMEGNSSNWLLDIDPSALDRLPDPASTYAAIISAWQRWCECTKRVGGFVAAQKLLTDSAALRRDHGPLPSHWPVRLGRQHYVGGAPASNPKHLGDPQLYQIHGTTISSANRDRGSPRVQLSPVGDLHSGPSLPSTTPGAGRGHPTIHRKSKTPRPRQLANTQVVSKTDIPLSTSALRTPRQLHLRACTDPRVSAARSPGTTVDFTDLAAARDTYDESHVESAKKTLQYQPRDTTSRSSLVEEGEAPSVQDDSSDSCITDDYSSTDSIDSGDSSNMSAGVRTVNKHWYGEERRPCGARVGIEAEARKPKLREGLERHSGSSYQHDDSSRGEAEGEDDYKGGEENEENESDDEEAQGETRFNVDHGDDTNEEEDSSGESISYGDDREDSDDNTSVYDGESSGEDTSTHAQINTETSGVHQPAPQDAGGVVGGRHTEPCSVAHTATGPLLAGSAAAATTTIASGGDGGSKTPPLAETLNSPPPKSKAQRMVSAPTTIYRALVLCYLTLKGVKARLQNESSYPCYPNHLYVGGQFGLY